MAKLLLLAPVFLLAVFLREGEPVRCWVCSSDLYPPCSNNMSLVQENSASIFSVRMVNCDVTSEVPYPYLPSNKKSVCKKMKKIVQGTEITIRGCLWKSQYDISSHCSTTSENPDEVITYCRTCEYYGGCNGA